MRTGIIDNRVRFTITSSKLHHKRSQVMLCKHFEKAAVNVRAQLSDILDIKQSLHR